MLAVRIVDRNGRPVREGVAGDFTLNEPFQSASQLELQQLRQLIANTRFHEDDAANQGIKSLLQELWNHWRIERSEREAEAAGKSMPAAE